MLAYTAMIFAILCSASALSVAEEKNATNLTSSRLLDSWNDIFVEELSGFPSNFNLTREQLQCVNSTISGTNNFTKVTKQKMADCLLEETASFRKCVSRPLFKYALEYIELFDKVVACVPLASRVEQYYKMIIDQKHRSEDSLKEIKKNNPERSGCVDAVMKKINDIAMNGVMDMGRCADLKSISTVHCLETVKSRTFMKILYHDLDVNKCIK